ncbi:hypothetical protein CYY_009552 [Polysphondylium violaceum]|uniref:EGF-like domain-containing protein n=1 Tax=Polysphondylium violaceum TaxID=133409 RepID=A0A8J4PLB3_9MYCE|nr:hypothetical protein CYY_009552 [Polysphondylium violaceum]
MKLSYIYLLFVFLFLCQGSLGQALYAQVDPILPFGIEPYAGSNGICFFDFYVNNFFDLDVVSNYVSCNILLPVSVTTTCQMATIRTSHSTTTTLVKTTMTSDSSVFNNIQLQIILFNGTSFSVNLNRTSEVPLTYNCKTIPENLAFTHSITEARLLNTSYSISTFRFQSYLTLDPAYERPIPDELFSILPTVGFKINTRYIKGSTYLLTFDFLQGDPGPAFLLAFMVKLGSLGSYQVTVPLTYGKYPNVAMDSKVHYPFKNTPNIGNYLQYKSVDSSMNVAPVFYQDFTPLFGQSFANFSIYFKNTAYTDITGQYVMGNSWKNLGVIFARTTYESLSFSFVYPKPTYLTFNIDTFKNYHYRFKFYFDEMDTPNYYYYPFGMINTLANSITYQYQVFLKDYENLLILNCGVETVTQYPNNANNGTDTMPPTVESYSLLPLNETLSVLRLELSDNLSGVYFAKLITDGHVYYIKIENLVMGDIVGGTYELLVPFKKRTSFNLTIYDNAGNVASYSNDLLHYHMGVPQMVGEPLLASLLSTFYFDKNSVSVANSPVDVVLYADLVESGQNKTNRVDWNSLYLKVFISRLAKPLEVVGRFNTSKQLYQFPFTIPQKLMNGNLNYSLYINEQQVNSDTLIGVFGSQAQVFIDNPGEFDMMFPIVTQFLFSPNDTTSSSPLLQFSLTLDEPMKKVVVQIVGDYDHTGKNYTFVDNEPISINFQVDSARCRPQFYFIRYMYTEDLYGNKGEYIRHSSTGMHQFYKFPDLDLPQDVYYYPYISCPSTVVDTNPPSISSLFVQQVSDIHGQQVNITFIANDNTGMSSQDIPLCVFHARNNNYFAANATILLSGPNSIKFQCLISIPIGVPPQLLLSIYGIMDLHFNYIGFTAIDLGAEGQFTLTPFTKPIISSLSFDNTTNTVILTGHNFAASLSGVNITFDGTSSQIYNGISTNTTIILTNIPLAYNYSIQVIGADHSLSNSVIFIRAVPTDFSSSSLSSSDSSVGTPPPSPTPVVGCKSDCSVGQGYGKCVNGGCVCNSPHSGLDCKSVVDTKPVIKPNPVKPSVNITIPGTSSSESPQFTSFIYVVALRELDNTDTLINNYEFNSDKWILVNEGSFSNEQVTTVAYKYLIDNSYNTTIVSTVQVFEKETNVTFGNQQLFMNPSTIKFTFNITSYPFTKSTNSLQLVMTAALESTEKVACSYKEFVDDENSSQYLTLQIEDRSLFGRFIKFGMIDGREQVVTNTQLDNIYGGKELSKSTSDQSYIGLNIPYYTKYALLDPDFSVLIEQNTARDQSNSICTKESKKLTNAQIAGIVVGGVVFILILAAVVIYRLSISSKGSFRMAIKLRKIMGK